MPALIRISSVLLLSLFTASALAAAPAAPAGKAGTAEPASLTPVMAGEFALQAGKLPEAARWYLEAAEAGRDDAGLAERATRIAMLADDDKRATRALALWEKRAPRSLSMRSAAAALDLRKGDVKGARTELASLLRDPDPRGWKFALAALVGGGRDPAAAADVLGRLVDDNAIPNQLEPWQEFGRLAMRMDRPELARRMVDEVVRRFPGEPRVALLNASLMFQAGKTDDALAALHSVEPRTAEDPELRNAVAIAYDAMGDATSAERVLAVGPQNVQTWGMRASLLAKQKDDVALLALYTDLSKQATKPDPAQRLLLGKIAEYLKRHAEAVDWYLSVPGGEERAEARLRAASAQYELGQTDKAFAGVHAIQSDAMIDDEARRDAYLLEAELRQRGDDLPGELDALARGLAAYPDENALLYARALAWERRDDVPRAEADLRKILVTEPENVAALNALGYTLADRTTRYQEALELIDRARVAEPDNAAIVDSYGWVLYRLGRNEEALVQLRRAWTLAKDPEIAAHVGEVLWVLGRKDEARRFFDEARKLDPENRALQRVIEKYGV
ncbi:tetratricopeptide repeat protein [Stenotrophomonas rhizophila]|jgi:predicted Zn-dependent protease|uniref:tetratricopeptide repeat protein n=1 Tax=Stenotrophomonas rhizophila TaxID=216778 RepID=UPI00081CE078|nr:tetratricopeptide repeat protein [Stenotrophomonas rhizophila]AOA71337.1 membrane protein [Stenotrophomonas rhizophila]UQY88437.1 tetratricopeptide repeat protein [Stenotrophomonas rhizophila]